LGRKSLSADGRQNACRRLLERLEQFGHKKANMFQAIGPPAKEHNRYFELRQILLRGNLLIDSDKGIELLLSQREQVTILDSSPASARYPY